MKNILIFFIAIILSPLSLGAEDYEIIPETFIGHVKNKEFESAAKSLYPGEEAPDWNTPKGQSLITQLITNLGYYKDYRFHEIISEEKSGSRYITLTYIVGMQYSPVFMSFELYKPESTWTIKSFKYNGSLHNLIKERAE